jgi:hypothetical protein
MNEYRVLAKLRFAFLQCLPLRGSRMYPRGTRRQPVQRYSSLWLMQRRRRVLGFVKREAEGALKGEDSEELRGLLRISRHNDSGRVGA